MTILYKKNNYNIFENFLIELSRRRKMVNVKALPLIVFSLILAYFALIIDANSPVVNPIVKTSSGSVRGITKTVMEAKVDVFLGVIST